jgi:hypothetical protein
MADEETTQDENAGKSDSEAEIKEADTIRIALGDTYTFIRSRELNKTLIGYTFDHYIDEAKRAIKDPEAPSTDEVVRRPSSIDRLVSLEASFQDALTKLRKKVEKQG